MIVVDQSRHSQEGDKGEQQPLVLKNVLTAGPPHAERHRQAEADGESQHGLPNIGVQRDLEPPAQQHHGEYHPVGNTRNVQESELHVEDAAECQENENQQYVEPQPLERGGIVHECGDRRGRERRHGERLTVVRGCGHSGNCLQQLLLPAVSDSTTGACVPWAYTCQRFRNHKAAARLPRRTGTIIRDNSGGGFASEKSANGLSPGLLALWTLRRLQNRSKLSRVNWSFSGIMPKPKEHK